MVKRAIFYGRKDMPLSINGAKLGVLIWFKNGQTKFPLIFLQYLRGKRMLVSHLCLRSLYFQNWQRFYCL